MHSTYTGVEAGHKKKELLSFRNSSRLFGASIFLG
jgi:hypothetical protein